jgi:hypothetical protein
MFQSAIVKTPQTNILFISTLYDCNDTSNEFKVFHVDVFQDVVDRDTAPTFLP